MTHALITQMLEALEFHQRMTRPITSTGEAISAAREYLAAPEQSESESEDNEPFKWYDPVEREVFADAMLESKEVQERLIPLYLRQQPAELTDAQVADALAAWFSKELEYNSSMETRMRAAFVAAQKGKA